MASQDMKTLIEEKARLRLAMRNDYLKKMTNPHTAETGHIVSSFYLLFIAY